MEGGEKRIEDQPGEVWVCVEKDQKEIGKGHGFTCVQPSCCPGSTGYSQLGTPELWNESFLLRFFFSWRNKAKTMEETK